MNNPGSLDAEVGLSLDDRIDLACDHFESRWATNGRITIDDALLQFDGDERELVLKELLLVELEIRLRNQEWPRVDDFLSQFPGYERTVRDAFDAVNVTQTETLVKGADLCDTKSQEPNTHRPTEPAEPYPRTIGKYRVIEALDRGGQATVYRAVHPELARDVVVKFVHDSQNMNAESQERLRTEGRLLAELDHPNLARVYDFDFEGNRAYLVMEFVRGLNLRQYKRQAAPDFRRSVEVLEQVAGALAYVHQRGILHLDIKPENILLDETGRPRLIDFGLARAETLWSTAGPDPEFLSGTLSYMSPEQARCDSQNVGPASDIHGLGGVLYFLLTGQAPVTGKNFEELLTKAQNADWDRSRLDDSVPEGARSVCLRAMASDPADRFPTAGDMAAALRVLHAPPSRWRTKISAAGLAVAVGVLLAVWAVTSFWKPDSSNGKDLHKSSDMSAASETNRASGTIFTPEQLTSELHIRVWREGRFYGLVDSAPVGEGDRVEVRSQIPAGLHVSVFLFDTEGKLQLLESVPPADAPYGFRFPSDASTSAPIVGPPGTEFILLCGRRGIPVTVGEVQQFEEFASALPRLPDDSVVQIQSAEVDFLQKARSFGAPVATFDPQQAVFDRLEAIRMRLTKTMDVVEGIAFSHAE